MTLVHINLPSPLSNGHAILRIMVHSCSSIFSTYTHVKIKLASIVYLEYHLQQVASWWHQEMERLQRSCLILKQTSRSRWLIDWLKEPLIIFERWRLKRVKPAKYHNVYTSPLCVGCRALMRWMLRRYYTKKNPDHGIEPGRGLFIFSLNHYYKIWLKQPIFEYFKWLFIPLF